MNIHSHTYTLTHTLTHTHSHSHTHSPHQSCFSSLWALSTLTPVGAPGGVARLGLSPSSLLPLRRKGCGWSSPWLEGGKGRSKESVTDPEEPRTRWEVSREGHQESPRTLTCRGPRGLSHLGDPGQERRSSPSSGCPGAHGGLRAGRREAGARGGPHPPYLPLLPPGTGVCPQPKAPSSSLPQA